MRLAVAATPAVAIPTLEWLLSSEHEIAFIVTQVDRPAGRGKELKETSVALWATKHGIEIIKPLQISQLQVPLTQVDLLLTIAFGTILPLEVLSSPKHGSINMHFSLLPKWRGAAPVQRSIQNGDTVGGVTIFSLDRGMDTGPIYLQEEFPYPDKDSSGEILEKLAQLGPNLVERTIHMISQSISPTPQDGLGATYAPKVTRADSCIQWGSSADEIVRGIRAFTPDPGAWTLWRGAPLQISRAEIVRGPYSLKTGELAVVQREILVGCGIDSTICLHEVIPAGKKLMSASAWSNGARILVGESFG